MRGEVDNYATVCAFRPETPVRLAIRRLARSLTDALERLYVFVRKAEREDEGRVSYRRGHLPNALERFNVLAKEVVRPNRRRGRHGRA